MKKTLTNGGLMIVDRERHERLERDISDMQSSPAALFLRCACGRVKTQGWTCPTNAEGGDCEAGR